MTSPSSSPEAPNQPTRLGLGVTLGLLASLAFATSGPFVRPLFDIGWTPGAAVFWRVAAAAVLMVPVGLWLVRGRARDLLREWRAVLAFGAFLSGGAAAPVGAKYSRWFRRDAAPNAAASGPAVKTSASKLGERRTMRRFRRRPTDWRYSTA